MFGQNNIYYFVGRGIASIQIWIDADGQNNKMDFSCCDIATMRQFVFP